MKYYRMEPTYKKSVSEYRVWRKDIDGKQAFATYEILWRWASFKISVPETVEEFEDWLTRRGYSSKEEVFESYGEESFEGLLETDIFMPTEAQEWVDVDDYDWEVLDCWDSCYEGWTTNCHGADESFKEELQEKIESLYEEGYEEAIESDGWVECASYYEIATNVTLDECDENGHILQG